MLASVLWPVTALICRLSTFTEERTERTVTVVALREWFVKYGWIPAHWVMFFSIFSSVLWPKTFLSNQMLSSSGLNLTLASLGHWNNASTSGFRWERYALIVLTGNLLEPGMRIFSHLRDLHCHQCRPCDF